MTLDVNEEGDNNNNDFLLVLISSTAITKTQIKRQNVAMTILDANGLSPEVLDAADPNNSNVKDELLKLSNRAGQYPQFFVVDHDETIVLGGYDDLFYANEHGKVLEWLSMEYDVTQALERSSCCALEADEDTCCTESCRSHNESAASTDPPRDILISTESMVRTAQYISHEVLDDGDNNDVDDEDASVDSSATSSSILTWNRWTDVDIVADPSNGVHFQLRPDESSSCVVKLTNTSSSLQPVTFAVDASSSDNILVSPSFGILNNGESVFVHVTFTEDAKDDMLNLFDKLGPAAEFCQNDRVLIKYCGFSKHLLTDCQADDMKTLSSFWDIRESNNECLWNELNLRVRVSEGRRQNLSSHRPQLQSHTKTFNGNLWLTGKTKPVSESSSKRTTAAAAAALKIVSNRTMETVSTSASTITTPSIISLAEF